MGVLEAELFSFIIVLAILFDARSHLDKRFVHSSVVSEKLLVLYLLFLILGTFVHTNLEGIIALPVWFGQIALGLHSITLMAFVLMWMDTLISTVIKSSTRRILLAIESLPLLLYLLFSPFAFIGFDFPLFKEMLVVGSRSRFEFLILTTGMYCVIAFALVVVRWNLVDQRYRLAHVVTPVLLLISIIFFRQVREHLLFTLGSSFLLLTHHLMYQHRRFEIDPLTAVGNQHGFLGYLDTILGHRKSASLVALDIENFRAIESSYDQIVADRVLREFACYLMGLEGTPDVYRIGGNRFVLGFPLLSHNEVVRLIKRIQGRTLQVWNIESNPISFHVNIGIVEIPKHADSISQVLDSIEFLIQETKGRRRQSVIIHNHRMIRLRQRRMDVLSALRRAIAKEELVKVNYQPIYRAVDGNLVAAEALMRIEDDQLGTLMPGEFIDPAENSGLIAPLTTILMKQVCRFITSHPDRLEGLDFISVNISAGDLLSHDFSIRLKGLLDDSGLDPKRLCLETTESMVMTSLETVRQRLDELSASGVRFALDDFGTGYANLEVLANVPFDFVKIDRSVLSNTAHGSRLFKLTAMVLGELGKTIVAEGVETAKQFEMVKSEGVGLVQGYYFSKPVSAEKLLELVGLPIT